MTDHPTAGARLSTVAAAVGGTLVGGAGDPWVRDVTHDSRQAAPEVLFAARPGARADGHDFAPGAVAAGSPALLVERPVAAEAPQVQVASVAEALGPAAAEVHGHPSRELTVLGVTGTNGKTTTTTLLQGVLEHAGLRAGLIGTTGVRGSGWVETGVRTTPEASDLQRLLRRLREEGVQAAAMEVSSHGLALGRMGGTRVAVAGFTNLSQDHLDFHGDMERYAAAKARLLTPALSDQAVVCIDDAWGRRLAQEATVPLTTVGLDAADADVRAVDVALSERGASFAALGPGWRQDVTVPLPGRFNVINALLALTMSVAAGLDADTAARGLAAQGQVRGRMERVEAGQPFTVLVDYAHTPEAVAGVLEAARELATGRVTVVLGCGGERDRGKREPMGRAAARADRTVLTSDNPRSEDPEAILATLVSGAHAAGPRELLVEPDRREAIAAALARAEAGDVVVIAGKGHETTQDLGDRVIDFDDRVVAREVLGERGGGW